MSVHAAKGLEADNVLILNCSQDQGGFPSRISDDPILGFVLSQIDTYEYSEERRLFYVAITRARKHTYVLYNIDMPSVFVTEMQNDDNTAGQLLCPRCKKGRLKKIKDGVSVNGNKYRNYLCTNSVAGCHFFWQVYYDKEDDILNKYHRQMDISWILIGLKRSLRFLFKTRGKTTIELLYLLPPLILSFLLLSPLLIGCRLKNRVRQMICHFDIILMKKILKQ